MEQFITVGGSWSRALVFLDEGMGECHLLWQDKGMQKAFLAIKGYRYSGLACI